MMDEQLIDEVAQHGVIFNRQKYYLNGGGGAAGGAGCGVGPGKYETKDEAWQIIAMKLRTDVETCKKRWKYLRERYVSQRKQGDPPVYEHLSRPYLEKMKFLDQHIQPRKSYRNVPSFLTSPHSANSSNYGEYMDSSKSNGSLKNSMHYTHYQDQHAMNALSSAAAAASALENGSSIVKTEADQVFRNFAAAVASQQLQQMSQTQSVATHHQQAVAAAAAMAASTQNYQEQFRENGGASSNGAAGVEISALTNSMKSPMSPPLVNVNNGHEQTVSQQQQQPQQATVQSAPSGLQPHVYNDTHNDDVDSSTSSNFNMKKPRVQIPPPLASTPMHNHNTVVGTHHANNNNNANSHFVDDSDDDSDEHSSMLQPLGDHHANHYHSSASSSTSMQRHTSTANNSGHNCNGNQQQQQQGGVFPANADFLFQLYQQLPQQQQPQQQPSPHQSMQPQQPQHVNKFQLPHALPQRSSEHLLGELVTTELLKMPKERRKNVQKRILEILFFDD